MTDALSLALPLGLLLLALLGSGMLVGVALLVVATVATLTAQPAALVGPTLSFAVWGGSSGWELAALPMFVWMGEILSRSRLAADLFAGLAPWLGRLPGGLLHVNVAGCAVFAAISGSSAATTATIGRIALPELERRGYDDRLAIGALAGSGTLGLLIPPSIILIVYGAATEQSIARLFIAGVIPGAVLALLFMGALGALSLLRGGQPAADPASWGDRLRGLKRLAPAVGVILGVIGAIYGGLASPTEAAAVGVFASLLTARAYGDLTRAAFIEGLLSATRVSAMICFILAGAAALTAAMGYTGLPRALATWIAGMGLSQTALIAALTVLFVGLGCFLDGISMVVLTASIVLPMVELAGIDLIWFGIFIVIVVEMAQITPPVGFNLFVIQGMTGRSILWIARATAPFFLVLLAMVALLTAFPGLALWLPGAMFGG